MEIEVKDSEDRRQRQKLAERVQIYGRRLTAQQRDERQDNGDKKRLEHHHPSDLLHLLTRKRIGGGQHGVILSASRQRLAISNFSSALREALDAHICIPSIDGNKGFQSEVGSPILPVRLAAGIIKESYMLYRVTQCAVSTTLRWMYVSAGLL